MPNQYVNKVVFGDQTLLDLTTDTVTPSVLMEGYTAHDKSGALIIGTATGGGTGAISVVDTEDTHGGTIRTITAVDISDTTAVAEDVAQGKYFYTADGTKAEGTSSGGGGLEYETGTWSPSSDNSGDTVISFSSTHNTMPFFVSMYDIVDEYDSTLNTCYAFTYYCFDSIFGGGIWSSTTSARYGESRLIYRGSSATSTSLSTNWFANPPTNTGDGTGAYPRFFVKETGFTPRGLGYYWRAGHTYKWIAVWAPTT